MVATLHRRLRQAMLLVLALACLPLAAEEPLRLGVFAYRPKPIIEQRFQPLADYLSKALDGRPVELRALDQNEMETALDQNRLDLLMTNPSHFLVVRSQSRLAAVLATVLSREDGQETASLGGVIITTAGRSDINTLKDLRDRRIGAPGTRYLGGYQTQALELMDAGIPPPSGDRLLILSTHDKVVDAVLSGEVDVGFVRTGVIESMEKEGRLDPDRLKVINPQGLAGFPYRISTRLYPEWPFIALPTVDRETLRRLSAALLALDAQHPATRGSRIAGFVPAADYSAVDQLARRLRSPPYDQAPRITLNDVWQQYRLPVSIGGAGLVIIMVLLLTLARRHRQLITLTAALRDMNSSLETRVADRTAELLAAKAAAESASRAKSAFLANMSHELRTPMSGVLGMLEMARRRMVDPKGRDQLDKAKFSAERLLGLVNDILDLSKIEAERMVLEDQPLKLADSLDNLTATLGHKAAEKGLGLVIDLTPSVAQARLRGDPLRLGQILLNLVGNAIKFTEQGRVELHIRPLTETPDTLQLRFEITDTGIGIDAEAQARLFQSFEQADNSMTRKYGGSGLGLAICKRLVELMGGEIGVSSTPGAGSTFWFVIPLKKQPAQPGSRQHAAGLDNEEDDLSICFSGQRILLVEDEPINQEISTGLLEEVGLIVDLAENGQKALVLARHQVYSLILMDMQMPVMNGLDATAAIRADSLNTDTPILAMTANAFNEDRDNALAAGMNDHIAKPVDPARLYEALRYWLGR